MIMSAFLLSEFKALCSSMDYVGCWLSDSSMLEDGSRNWCTALLGGLSGREKVPVGWGSNLLKASREGLLLVLFGHLFGSILEKKCFSLLAAVIMSLIRPNWSKFGVGRKLLLWKIRYFPLVTICCRNITDMVHWGLDFVSRFNYGFRFKFW